MDDNHHRDLVLDINAKIVKDHDLLLRFVRIPEEHKSEYLKIVLEAARRLDEGC